MCPYTLQWNLDTLGSGLLSLEGRLSLSQRLIYTKIQCNLLIKDTLGSGLLSLVGRLSSSQSPYFRGSFIRTFTVLVNLGKWHLSLLLLLVYNELEDDEDDVDEEGKAYLQKLANKVSIVTVKPPLLDKLKSD